MEHRPDRISPAAARIVELPSRRTTMNQMDNFTGRPTVEIHVYGDDLRGLNRSRYNLETGEITPLRY